MTFAVKSPAVEQRERVVGTLELRVEHSPVPVGVLHFLVELVPRGCRKNTLAEPLGDFPLRTESVFVSYASEDRAEVLRRIQVLNALGIRYFHDILSLSPGERWERELWRHIDNSSVFLLCWWNSARLSEWVRKEYLRACEALKISQDQRPHITILPLEGPPPPEPPDELRHLHFSDSLLYALKVEGDLAAEKP